MIQASAWGDIDAVILAGGLGTRLRPALPDRPKALAEVKGRPFLDLVMQYLLQAGLRRVVLALGYGADAIIAHIDTNPIRDLEVVPSVETSPLGTGGAIRHALDQTQAGTLLVLNGDSFTPADLGSFRTFHTRAEATVSLIAVPTDDMSRYGQLEIEPDGRVRGFVEKSLSNTGHGYINAGIYLIGRSIVADFPTGRPVSLETEIFPGLIGQGLSAMVQDIPFIDIGTPETWDAADQFFAMIGDEDVQ
jgi:NDP-sugar pyrophosphorylase family protein